MPVTRSARTRRAVTRLNTKRTILSALDENKPASIEQLEVQQDAPLKPLNTITTSNHHNDLPDLDLSNEESIKALLQDIRKEVTARQESISIKSAEIANNTQEAFFVHTMKLEKSVKKMTLKEFNRKFMGDGESIIQLMRSITIANEFKAISSVTAGTGFKKRAFTPSVGSSYLPMETPVRQLKIGSNTFPTPGTILRTAQKGEAVFSQNGSPIDDLHRNNEHQHQQEGVLVATVSKKRRGNGADDNGEGEGGAIDAMFDINIGHGRYVSLSDPTTMEHLTSEMKSTAKNQLNVLQDQLSKLLSQLK